MTRGQHPGELEAMLLFVVARIGERANGVAVYRELVGRTGRDPSLPAIHVTLRRLEEKGLLRSRVGSPSERGGRPRRFYRLTPAGAAALRDVHTMWSSLWSGLDLGPAT